MSTNRDRSSDSRTGTFITSVNRWNNKPSATTIYPAGFDGQTKHISDNSHPGYAQRIKNGEIVLGDLYAGVATRSHSDGSYSFGSGYSDGWNITVTGDLMAIVEGVSDRTHSWEDSQNEMKPRVLVAAYAKIRDDSIMSGELMSDLGQSLGMLQHPFRKARKLVNRIFTDAQKSYRKTAKSVTQANADAWLEYRYGWKPLFLDVRQGLKLYSQGERRLQRVRRVVRSGEAASFRDANPFTDVAAPYPWGFTATGSVSQNVKFSCDAGVIYTISGRSQSQALSEDLRLGIDSLASTGWEIIPHSFVADWFIRVGPWLEAINLPPSVSVMGNWVTSTYDLTFHRTGSGRYWNPYKWRYEPVNIGTSSIHQTGVKRTVNQQLPQYPPANFRLPGVIRATDALALLTSPINGLLTKVKH